MCFHASCNLPEGPGSDQSEVIADFGGDSAEINDVHSFRIASHPAAALQAVMPKKGQCNFLSTRDMDTAHRATQELGLLSVRDASPCTCIASQGVHDDRRPLHARTSYHLREDGASNRVSASFGRLGSIIIPVGEYERPGSPAPSVASTQWSTSSATATRAQRTRFLVFMKILFKVLDQAQEHEILDRAKQIVAECTRRNRSGDPSYVPLMDAVETRLRRYIGESYWRKASMLLRHFVLKHE